MSWGVSADLAEQRVEEKLGDRLGEDAVFYWVRSVAPQKEMYCVSFRLPYAVAYAP